MGAKIHDYGNGTWVFYCPGCGYDHSFRVRGDASRPQWTWNGSVESPSFHPSLMVNHGNGFPVSLIHGRRKDPVPRRFTSSLEEANSRVPRLGSAQ